ncbi:MAG TPA: prolyl oligopeptidase family serine peptidase [Edaphobacter sp.]|nr:prolyl oligopeptidase family serine peptidase [Edaphobacter sp.]
MNTTSVETTLELTYPVARKVEQTDDYFGTTVSDPYRWMEDVDSAEVKAWIDAENELTQRYLAQIPVRETMQRRLMELIDFERYTAPARRGTRYFYSHNSGLQNQNVLYWQEGLDGEPKVLLDPNTFSEDGTVAISGISITDDGSLAAYSIADAGSDWVKWHVRNVTTGEDLPDVIEWSKFSGASWMKDGSGFFYARYDEPAADASEADTLKTANYFHKVYFHRLGTPQSADTLVFHRPDDGEINIGAQVTDDGRYLLLHQSKGTSPNNELTVQDLLNIDRPLQRLIDTPDATYVPINNDGTLFWLLTTLDAPNGKVISIDLHNPEREHWKTVIPESTNKLSDISIIDNTFIVNYLADAQSLVELRRLDGSLIERLPLPAIGTAVGFGGLREDTETFYQFTNFTTPGATYRLDMKTRKSTLYRQPKLLFDPDLYETKQIFAASKDGTRVPMFISHKKGLVLDGTAPTLLYAYGGFNISLMPEFSPSHVMWMEMGGVYAQASLRGGGEYGEAWHTAGTRVRKQNVFDDFISLAEWLITNEYTSPKRLAISGGSNGGLLVAACELQRPDLFGAVVAQVGVMDMLRFHQFTIGWAWKEEYGSPTEDAAEFAAIYKYSPLHNIRDGESYPATLITTGDHDDRVFPAHSFKYAAALQAAQSGPNPVLIRVETRAGHGAGMPLSKRIEATVDQYAFMAKELQLGTGKA